MSFSKYFFEQHGESLKKEGELYKARGEKKEIDSHKCKHKDVKIEDNILKCGCGAFWQGAGIEKLKKILTT